MSGIVNKIKDVLHKDHSTTSSTTHGTSDPNSHLNSATSGSTNHGGHNSNLANKADPRIDSDRDGSNIPGAAGHSGVSNTHHNTTGHSSGLTGNSHSTTTGHSSGLTGNTHSGVTSGSTNHGPHDSNLANKADPRVDSDRSNTHNTGFGSNTHNTTTGHSTGLGSSNTHGTTGHSTNAGPHNSNILNKMDPKVDSDLDGSNRHTGGTHTTGSGLTQNNHASHLGTNQGHSVTHGSTNNGPHDSNLANKADPRVDSDRSSAGNRLGGNHNQGVFGQSGSHATSGSGTAQNTSGPHNSDLLNKLDPRVDSDKDGSKTVGGNKTHA